MGKPFTSVNVPFQANAGFSAIGSSYSGFSSPYSAPLASSLTTRPSSFNSTTLPFQANTGLSTSYSAPLASGISAPYSTSVASSYATQQGNLAGDNAGSRFYEKYSAERDRQYRSTIDKTATLYQQSNLGKQVSGSYSAPLSSMASSFNSTTIPFQAKTGLSASYSTPLASSLNSTNIPFQATTGISTPMASSFNSTTIPFQANRGLSTSYSTPLASSLSSASIPLQATTGLSASYSAPLGSAVSSQFATSAAGAGNAGANFYQQYSAERDRKLREGINNVATLL